MPKRFLGKVGEGIAIVVDASALARLILMEPGREEVAERVKGSLTVDHAVKEVETPFGRLTRGAI